MQFMCSSQHSLLQNAHHYKNSLVYVNGSGLVILGQFFDIKNFILIRYNF